MNPTPAARPTPGGRAPSSRTTGPTPKWWTDKHASSWEHVKSALKRDWEQTKADLSKRSGHELNQGAFDTLKQASGQVIIPAEGESNAVFETFEQVEPAYRYGHGASQQYVEEKNWDAALEQRLEAEWGELHDDQPWREVRIYVQRGWERARD